MVKSMNRCSISASLRIAWTTRSNTPSSRQREKRTYVRCQCPNSAGRLCQELLVRMTQRTASTNRRLSLAVTPRSLALHGRSRSISSHWSSRNIFRSILTPPKSQDMTIIFNRCEQPIAIPLNGNDFFTLFAYGISSFSQLRTRPNMFCIAGILLEILPSSNETQTGVVSQFDL